MEKDLQEIIAEALAPADPNGAVAQRLRRLSEKVARNVMPSLGDRAFLRSLQVLRDNVECLHVRSDGLCTEKKTPCAHVARYDLCPQYARMRSHLRRGESPIAGQML